jgi:hypothetical protein
MLDARTERKVKGRYLSPKSGVPTSFEEKGKKGKGQALTFISGSEEIPFRS